jgi:hypothetical protein
MGADFALYVIFVGHGITPCVRVGFDTFILAHYRHMSIMLAVFPAENGVSAKNHHTYGKSVEEKFVGIIMKS